MELAWNTQKSKMSDLRGKENEQERKGKIKNADIDLSKTSSNITLLGQENHLYRDVKKRVAELKQNGSRVQKNSVVSYSNIFTVSSPQFEEWGQEKTIEYFQCCTAFFQERFGIENVVSAKIHFDESAPHMHLHFLPVSKEGKLQAHKVMNKENIREIHDTLPLFLQNHGFEVERASGLRTTHNIEDVHLFKKVKQEVVELERERVRLSKIVEKNEGIIENQNIEISKNRAVAEYFRKMCEQFEISLFDLEHYESQAKQQLDHVTELEINSQKNLNYLKSLSELEKEQFEHLIKVNDGLEKKLISAIDAQKELEKTRENRKLNAKKRKDREIER